MDRDKILDQIILAFRQLIEKRYEYSLLATHKDLPVTFDAEKVDRFKQYFLEYIYPDPIKRRELNEAFDQLDGYTSQPKKLLSILMESARVVFAFGRSLPKILTAGFSALRSFQATTKFEHKLVEAAIEFGMTDTIDEEEMKRLLRSLDQSEIESFMSQTESLFATLHDRSLVKKIKTIVETLIEKMKKKPAIFTEEEIDGLELGKEIIVKGDDLFQELSDEDQQNIFSFIIGYEREFFERLRMNDTV